MRKATPVHSLIRAMAASTPEMLDIFGDEALLHASLAFERELAKAEAAEGLIPTSSAVVIEDCCRAPNDVPAIAKEAAFAGTLALPLVKLLRERVAAIDPGSRESRPLRRDEPRPRGYGDDDGRQGGDGGHRG